MSTHTIGEVLNRLKGEFDDITISKIRFLEAEGLIHPDRTESGYRKFTEQDVDRLRYVLRAQRDRYLPLKVIKQELDRIDAGQAPDGHAEASQAEPERMAELAEDPGADSAEQPWTQRLTDADDQPRITGPHLADATGLTEADLASLREHGLLGSGPYDAADLALAGLASAMMADGLEPRHLRMYRQTADREASVIEQLVAPRLRQRNPDSRRDAAEQAGRLAESGARLHAALLARQLRTILRS